MDKWICVQYGAREEYTIPRVLFKRNKLESLVTDFWIQNMKLGRFRQELSSADVRSFNGLMGILRLAQRLCPKMDIELYFQKLANKEIDRIASKKNVSHLFSYSYSSLELFKHVNKRYGYKTFLGQINPGPLEAELVKNLYKQEFGNSVKPNVPNDTYWARWREECDLSDKIIVNSYWSKTLIEKEGIEKDKVAVMPLIYQANQIVEKRSFESEFSKRRPLRLLYLGGVEIRKGFHILKRSLKQLMKYPVHLDVVGPLRAPSLLLENLSPNVKYHGTQPRYKVLDYYDNADVFILPTYSDGFALTLLEAQARRLPIIATPFCGEVVINGQNGIVMPEISENCIMDSVKKILDQPTILKYFSTNSIDLNHFSIENVGNRLLEIAT